MAEAQQHLHRTMNDADCCIKIFSGLTEKLGYDLRSTVRDCILNGPLEINENLPALLDTLCTVG